MTDRTIPEAEIEAAADALMKMPQAYDLKHWHTLAAAALSAASQARSPAANNEAFDLGRQAGLLEAARSPAAGVVESESARDLLEEFIGNVDSATTLISDPVTKEWLHRVRKLLAASPPSPLPAATRQYANLITRLRLWPRAVTCGSLISERTIQDDLREAAAALESLTAPSTSLPPPSAGGHGKADK